MRSRIQIWFALFVIGSASACGGCANEVASNNDSDPTKEKLLPPPLQPASAPAIRPNVPAPAPLALKPSPAPSSAATKTEPPRTESRNRPADASTKNALAQGPGPGERSSRGEAGKDDRTNRGSRDRNGADKRGGPPGGGGNERRSFGPRLPGGDGERRNGNGRDNSPSMPRPPGDSPAGSETIVSAGGLGGETARKFKSPPLPEGIPSWFKENDKDGDGQVAFYEWPTDEFSKYDRNGDGFITIAEAMRFAPKPVTPPPGSAPAPAAPASPSTTPPTTPAIPGMTEDRTRQLAQDILNRYDRNRDGKLDQQELQNTTRLRMVWQQYDTNKDNMIDLEEMVAFVKGLNNSGGGLMITGGPGGGFGGFGGPGGGFGGPGGGFGGPGGGGRGGRGGPGGSGGNDEERARQTISRFDSNKDGKLSREEFPRFFGADRFDQLDTNRDGFIDLQEWMKGSDAMFRGGRR